MSDSADGESKSASKKSAKFGVTEIQEIDKATESDAEEEESDAVESPNEKRKVVNEEEKAAIKAKKDAEKADGHPARAARSGSRGR